MFHTGWKIETEMELGTQIKLEKNSACSAWVDLVELVSSQDMDVVDDEGEVVTEDFLLAMEDLRKRTPGPGRKNLYYVIAKTNIIQKYLKF
jgi:hypothetical protein